MLEDSLFLEAVLLHSYFINKLEGYHLEYLHAPHAVLSSGPITANPNTRIILVEILNTDQNNPRKVKIEIKNWTNCPPAEMQKSVFLCEKAIILEKKNEVGNEELNIQDETVTVSENIPPDSKPTHGEEGAFFSTAVPITITIPAQSRLTISAVPPVVIALLTAVYEIRISIINPDKILVSSVGLNADGIPQEGNTLVHKQFTPQHPNHTLTPAQMIRQRPF